VLGSSASQWNLHNKTASAHTFEVACTIRGEPLEGHQQRQKRTTRLTPKWTKANRKNGPTGRRETGAAGWPKMDPASDPKMEQAVAQNCMQLLTQKWSSRLARNGYIL